VSWFAFHIYSGVSLCEANALLEERERNKNKKWSMCNLLKSDIVG
jgi:hypothetical protein